MAEEEKKPELKTTTETSKLEQSLELYKKLRQEINLNATTFEELSNAAKNFDKIQSELAEKAKKGLSLEVYQKLKTDLQKSKDLYKEILTGTSSTVSRITHEFGEKVKKELSMEYVLEKVGLSLQSLNLPGLILSLFQRIDIGRVISGYTGEAAKIFGKMGSAAGDRFSVDFGMSMQTAGERTSVTLRFVTDQLREQLAQDFFKLGLQIRGINGVVFASLSNDLIAASQAFKIPLDSVAKYVFNFQDIFRVNTEKAMRSVKDVITNAYTLGVAPERFLNLIASQTEQFKLQRIQISEVSDAYRRFYQGLGLGVEVSEELTQKVVSSLAQLSSGKLAAYISLTTGFTGKDLTDTMLDFYRGQATGRNVTNSRLELVQNTLKVLQEKFPEITKNQYVGVKAVMEIFGVQQMEVGVRLYDALSKQVKGMSVNNDLMTTVNNILTNTKTMAEQGLNLVVNLLDALLRLSLGAYKFFVGKLSDDFLKPLEDEIKKQNEAMGTNFETLDMSKQISSTGLSKLDVIIIQQAKSNEHLKRINTSIQETGMANIGAIGATSMLPGGSAAVVPILAKLIDTLKETKTDVNVSIQANPELKGLIDFNSINKTYA